ncbi:MAG: O-antigen ligase family protein, partial [Bacteroides sp.]|nr:O-antigen ligase family protein [Bacteroides sp.]
SNYITNRAIFITLPLTYFLSGILLCNSKRLRMTLLLLGIFVITAIFKAYWQKRKGFDSIEMLWLIDGGAWHTHVLQSGIRYFSFFTDAGNFGACMGVLTLVFAIVGTVAKRFIIRYFFLGVAVLAAIGMMMSGTRGAMVIPFAGLVLFVLLSKSIKYFAICSILGIAAFCFFSFTDIGQDNSFIRRMRTAFRPTEDASFNVRLGNQKRFAYYLADKPFGVGVGGTIIDTEGLMQETEEKFIPTDSYYVGIWVEGGVVGLILYIGLQLIVFLRCCYLLLFKIKHKQLRIILSAMLCGIFGLCLNGYVGRAMGFLPGNFLIATFYAFILNGPYIDRQLKADERII